ncbi:unnamed protein product [Lasius platythorax]|uniref:Uncharacterized protein n=1 Tax=Lasius platythorax TaxID=488582 RepID=A0AAV2NHS5_9HYME
MHRIRIKIGKSETRVAQTNINKIDNIRAEKDDEIGDVAPVLEAYRDREKIYRVRIAIFVDVLDALARLHHSYVATRRDAMHASSSFLIGAALSLHVRLGCL